MGVTAYRIELRPSAAKALSKCDPALRARIRGVIELLAQDPRPPAARKLKGRPAYRIRTGDYRVIYTIDDGVLLVVVIALGHRREIYKT